MKQTELEDALLKYLARDDSDEPTFQSLGTIQETLPEAKQLSEEMHDDDEVEDKEQIRIALDQLNADGLVESRIGEREYEPSYRISQDGYYQSVLGNEALVPKEDRSSAFDVRSKASFDPDAFDSSAFDTDVGTSGTPIRSATWTGSQFTYVNKEAVRQLRARINELHVLAQRINYQSLSDERDLKGLANALVSLCDMAEPDILLIVRILAHPKFKIYAALFGAAATIRGALGI